MAPHPLPGSGECQSGPKVWNRVGLLRNTPCIPPPCISRSARTFPCLFHKCSHKQSQTEVLRGGAGGLNACTHRKNSGGQVARLWLKSVCSNQKQCSSSGIFSKQAVSSAWESLSAISRGGKNNNVSYNKMLLFILCLQSLTQK